MPFSSTIQTLHDGNRNVIMQFTGTCAGDGQETDVVKVDVSELLPKARGVKILKAQYDVYGGILRLSWATEQQSVGFLDLSRSDKFNWCKMGGQSNFGVDYATGDLLFSTLGMGAGDGYSITLEMVKQGVQL